MLSLLAPTGCNYRRENEADRFGFHVALFVLGFVSILGLVFVTSFESNTVRGPCALNGPDFDPTCDAATECAIPPHGLSVYCLRDRCDNTSYCFVTDKESGGIPAYWFY